LAKKKPTKKELVLGYHLKYPKHNAVQIFKVLGKKHGISQGHIYSVLAARDEAIKKAAARERVAASRKKTAAAKTRAKKKTTLKREKAKLMSDTLEGDAVPEKPSSENYWGLGKSPFENAPVMRDIATLTRAMEVSTELAAVKLSQNPILQAYNEAEQQAGARLKLIVETLRDQAASKD